MCLSVPRHKSPPRDYYFSFPLLASWMLIPRATSENCYWSWQSLLYLWSLGKAEYWHSFPLPSKMSVSWSLKPENVLPSKAKRLYRCAEIKDLEMERWSWVIWVSPMQSQCPFRRDGVRARKRVLTADTDLVQVCDPANADSVWQHEGGRLSPIVPGRKTALCTHCRLLTCSSRS